ncbi:MAG UNVERIFIED_CONTAM: hypothetical protein LVR18_49950 [Planctomycetaceae bacterium]
MRLGGEISTSGDNVTPSITSGRQLLFQEGADLAALGNNVRLTLHAEEFLTMPVGSALRAGVAVDLSTGSPVYTRTGTNGQIVLTSGGEVKLAGLVAASGGLSLTAGDSLLDHSAYFDEQTALTPTSYLAGQERYAILASGTVHLMGDNEHLVFSAKDDVVVTGNITMTGAGSAMTLQSDQFLYVEGRLTAAAGVELLGGVSLAGVVGTGADSRGSSVYLGSSGRIVATGAGAKISIHGAQDVDVHQSLVAGGTVGGHGRHVGWRRFRRGDFRRPADRAECVAAGGRGYSAAAWHRRQR